MMYCLYTVIGEHQLLIRTSSVRTVNWIKSYFAAHEVHEAMVKPDLLIDIEGDYGLPFEGFSVDIHSDGNQITYDRPDYHMEVNSKHSVARLCVHDEYALKHALMNLYSAFIVHHGWGLLIHSSCAVQDGRAYIFAGRSGAGKSTVARLSNPRLLLSDEAAIVRIDNGEVRIFDSPFRSDSVPKLSRDSFPLAAIHMLRQANNINKSLRTRSASVLHLVDKVFYWSYSPVETKKVLRLCAELAQSVPTYDLHFQKNDKFWEVVS